MELAGVPILVLTGLSIILITILNLFRTKYGKPIFWVNLGIYVLYGIAFPVFLLYQWETTNVEAGLAGFGAIIFFTIMIPGIHLVFLFLYSVIAHEYQVKKEIIPQREPGPKRSFVKVLYGIVITGTVLIIVLQILYNRETHKKQKHRSNQPMQAVLKTQKMNRSFD